MLYRLVIDKRIVKETTERISPRDINDLFRNYEFVGTDLSDVQYTYIFRSRQQERQIKNP